MLLLFSHLLNGRMVSERSVFMHNQDIRRTAAGAGVRLWQIADALGIADASFSRKLRKELPQEEKDEIFSIIRELSQEVS